MVYPMQDPAAGQPQSATTTSMDLPPAIASLIDMGGIEAPAPSTASMQPTAPSSPAMPAFEMGGQVGPGGQPMPMASQGPGLAQPGAAQQPMNPQQIQMEAQRFVQQHPQQVQQIQLAVQQGLQSGELTIQELNTLVQLATVALQNPAMYPQLRAMAIREGLATEQDISQQMDTGLLMTLIIVGQAIQSQGQAQPVPPQQLGASPAQAGGLPPMAQGGPLPEKAARKDGGIPIMAHEGEFVIPADVVRRKGTDFFEKMIQSDK